jgi:histidyl-tRNA synthetase
VNQGPSTVKVLVTQFDPALLPEYLALAAELRSGGVNTEIHLQPAKIARQFKYADRAGIPYAVVMGSDEMASGMVTVKDLRTGAQVSIPRADLLGHFLKG